MSLIAILGDTHLGARSGSTHFSEHFNSFFTDEFYPYLKKHNIKHVIQLGDLFDNRTQLNIKAYNTCKDVWFDPLVRDGIQMYTLLGNHDILYRSTLEVNTPTLLLADEYAKNLVIIDTPTTIDICGTTFAAIPWICDANREEVFEFMSNTKADICVGHFEISGFEMMRGIPGNGGLSREIFEKFELTLSGHFHTQSYDEYFRVKYVGTPYEITFADMHDPRGFHVFDTETRELTFIYNKNTMFDRIIYNDGYSGDISLLKGKIIKLIVEKKTDPYAFDRFIDSLQLVGLYDLNIIENFIDVNSSSCNIENIENPRVVINNYIDGLTTSVDKSRLKEYIAGLYAEALTK